MAILVMMAPVVLVVMMVAESNLAALVFSSDSELGDNS